MRGMAWQEPPFEGRHPTFNGEATHDAGKYGSCVTGAGEDDAFRQGRRWCG